MYINTSPVIILPIPQFNRNAHATYLPHILLAGAYHKTNPPYNHKKKNKYLWGSIKDGLIHYIADKTECGRNSSDFYWHCRRKKREPIWRGKAIHNTPSYYVTTLPICMVAFSKLHKRRAHWNFTRNAFKYEN